MKTLNPLKIFQKPYRKTLDWIKTLKVAAGCTVAYLLARAWGLNFPTSVVTITLLSILGTRRDTFITAGKRFLSFFAAALLSCLLFPATGYSVAGLALYLFFFHLICQMLKCTEGFSMSTVLMLHIWNAGAFTPAEFFNEFFLMTIGIVTAFFMNLYMPGKIELIRSYQSHIEEGMRAILMKLAQNLIRRGEDLAMEEQFLHLEHLLKDALESALYTEKNYVFRDMSYYAAYIRMRIRQFELLKRIRDNSPRLCGPYYQTLLTARFMEQIALSLQEHNNSKELLARLAELRRIFRQAPLPVTRQEFEARAVLYEIVGELEALLRLKREFAENLTDYQIRTFWRI